MDPAIERLVTPKVSPTPDPNTPGLAAVLGGDCSPGGKFIGNGSGALSGSVIQCQPNNTAFARLVNQLGAAIAPTAMHSSRTTGYGGFHLSLEGAFTSIDKNADYWQNGTRGPQDPAGKYYSTKNSSPASSLQVYSLKIRKGFPFGFEIAASVGMLSQTSIITGGADVRLALLEGFRKGALGVLPDLSAGGGVRTISGTPQFNLTVASFDAQLSKSFPVSESNIITPYLGFQYMWIFGDSGLVDATPNTDPLGYCRYTGPNTPGNADPKKSNASGQFYDGQPNCKGGSPLDFNNTFTFENVRLTRQRLIVGINYRYEMVYLGFQYMTDVSNPADAGGRDNAKKLDGVPKQSTMVIELGALFLAGAGGPASCLALRPAGLGAGRVRGLPRAAGRDPAQPRGAAGRLRERQRVGVVRRARAGLGSSGAGGPPAGAGRGPGAVPRRRALYDEGQDL
jgi:hypothetical protein